MVLHSGQEQACTGDLQPGLHAANLQALERCDTFPWVVHMPGLWKAKQIYTFFLFILTLLSLQVLFILHNALTLLKDKKGNDNSILTSVPLCLANVNIDETQLNWPSCVQFKSQISYIQDGLKHWKQQKSLQYQDKVKYI